MKPLGHKSYGSIPHLIGSRLGSGDHHASLGQCRIATEKKRDRHDTVYVQEKLDGGNVGVTKLNGKILAITRAGYLAETSPYKTHHAFYQWVKDNEERFHKVLSERQRLCGEWLLTSVGTKYRLLHEPFVAFDLMTGMDRTPMNKFIDDVSDYFVMPQLLSVGEPLSIETAITMLDVSGHGALEPVEGAIWRVERKGVVDFLVKYVRPDKVDGKYLNDTVFNEVPKQFDYLKDLVL